jgi:hypothetical protein
MSHNWVFDRLEWRFCRRIASSRPHRLRILHAVTHETGSTVVSLPIVMAVTGQGVWGALVIDLWLGLFYAVYAYLFHCAYDRLRPVPSPVVVSVLRGRAVHLPVPPPLLLGQQFRTWPAEQEFRHHAGERGRKSEAGLEIDARLQAIAGAGEPADTGIGRGGRTGEVGVVDRNDLGREEGPERIEQDRGLGAGGGPAQRSLWRGAHPFDFDRNEMAALQLDGAENRGARIARRVKIEGQGMGAACGWAEPHHQGERTRQDTAHQRRHGGVGRGV